jgi:hypothetical protein
MSNMILIKGNPEQKSAVISTGAGRLFVLRSGETCSSPVLPQ